MTFAGITCVVSHFICGIPPGGSFRLPVLTHLSLMALAWEIPGFLTPLIAVTSDLYPCGRSLDPFYIFPAFYRFLSWKTSIGGNVFFCLFTFVPKDLQEEAPVLKTSMKRQLTDKRD